MTGCQIAFGSLQRTAAGWSVSFGLCRAAAARDCRQSLDHGGGRSIVRWDAPHHDGTAAALRMVSRRWSSFASNSGATPLHSRSRGTILLRTPMPRASA